MSRLNIAVIGAGYWGKKVIAQILDLARTGDEMNLLGSGAWGVKPFIVEEFDLPEILNPTAETLL